MPRKPLALLMMASLLALSQLAAAHPEGEAVFPEERAPDGKRRPVVDLFHLGTDNRAGNSRTPYPL